MNNILELCKIFHCNINDLVNDSIIDIDSLDEDVKMNVVKLKKEKQSKVKGISKAMYIIAKIVKIALNLLIPLIVLIMIVSPFVINKISIKDNEIHYNMKSDSIRIIDDDKKIEIKYKDFDIVDTDNAEEIKVIKDVLTNNSKAKIITYVESGFLFLGAYVVILIVVLKNLEILFRNIYNGDTPFTLDNVKHIKIMAYSMIAAIILPNFVKIIFSLLLRNDVTIGFSLFDVVQILFLFAMAYIFEYGHEI